MHTQRHAHRMAKESDPQNYGLVTCQMSLNPCRLSSANWFSDSLRGIGSSGLFDSIVASCASMARRLVNKNPSWYLTALKKRCWRTRSPLSVNVGKGVQNAIMLVRRVTVQDTAPAAYRPAPASTSDAESEHDVAMAVQSRSVWY